MADTKNPNLPHLWEHFLGSEMEALAAYVYKFQGFNKSKDDKSQCLAGKFYRDMHCERPWQPIERLRLAIRFLSTKEGKKFSFLNCKWDESLDRLVLEGKVSPKEVSKSFDAYNNIIKWDEKALEGYFDTWGSKLAKEFDFTEQDCAPFDNPKESSVFSMDQDVPSEQTPVKRKYTRRNQPVEGEVVSAEG